MRTPHKKTLWYVRTELDRREPLKLICDSSLANLRGKSFDRPRRASVCRGHAEITTIYIERRENQHNRSQSRSICNDEISPTDEVRFRSIWTRHCHYGKHLGRDR